jgi:hypothetical protein
MSSGVALSSSAARPRLSRLRKMLKNVLIAERPRLAGTYIKLRLNTIFFKNRAQ